jgi:hypothetical protein
MKWACASFSKKAKDYNLVEMSYDAIRMRVEDARWVLEDRPNAIEELKRNKDNIRQFIGSRKYEELVDLTKDWPGGETDYADSEPDWSKFMRNGEVAVKSLLIDPESAQINWPYGFLFGSWRPPLSKAVEGYWTCGYVNARNRFGGFAGQTSFVVVLDPSGNVKYRALGTPQTDDIDIISIQCKNAVKLLPSPSEKLNVDDEAQSKTLQKASFVDELAKLLELKEMGALTDAEFDAAKAKVLGTSE